MGYLVIGAGRFGTSVLKTLYDYGETVLVIDNSQEKIQQIVDDGIASEAVAFDITDETTLEKLVNSDDFHTAFICIGKSLQTSVLATVMLKELGIKNIICKALSRIEGKVLEKVGATRVVYPEESMGRELVLDVLKPDVVEHLKFLDKYRIFEFRATKKLIGKTLIELELRKKYDMNVIGISRANVDFSIALNPNEKIDEGDTLLVIADVEKMIIFNKEMLK